MKDYQFVGHALLQTSAITALTSTRVYHGDRPTSSAFSSLPAITYYQLSGGARGNGIESKVFTINCYASDPAVARNLGDKVIDLFAGSSGTGVYGNSSSFTIARASVERDYGLMVDSKTDNFTVPIDVLIVYTVDTVS